jgi:GT2 family glycosyltransferase
MDEVETDVLIMNQDSWLEGTAALDLIAEKRDTFGLIGERITGEHPAFPNHGYIHGTFMFVRRDVINRVGNMDEKHFPLWGSTADYQLRVCRAGFHALPVQKIPGFRHARGKRNFGSAISQMLEREPKLRSKLIRTPPLVSVVINSYNHGRYLHDAVNSLIGGKTSLGLMRGQTLQSFEIIIVDDGSTDKTPVIGRQLENSWMGIRYIRQKNAGSAVAMNTGIAAAYGKYIAPLDADDLMRPSRLEFMLAACEAEPHKVACDNMILFREGAYIKDGQGKPHVWRMIPYDFETLLHKNTMHKGLMYPKKAWVEAGGYPVVMNRGREDWAFNVALGIKGWCGMHVDYGGYLYRREGQNRTLKNTTPPMRAQFQQQLFGIFPHIYAGDRPMGCCGGKSKSTGVVTMRRNTSQQVFPGAEGMTLLLYDGGNAGDSTWWGPVTNQRYIFGGARRRGMVDNRDVPGLTSMSKGGRPLFKVVPPDPPAVAKVATPPPAPPPAPTPQPVAAVAKEPAPAVVETVADLVIADVPDIEETPAAVWAPDPREMTVSAVKKLVEESDFSPEQISYMLDLERKRDSVRVTLVSFFEGELGD